MHESKICCSAEKKERAFLFMSLIWKSARKLLKALTLVLTATFSGDSSRKDAFSLSVKSVRFNMCHNSTLHFNDPSIVVKKSNEHEHKFTGDNDEYQLLPNKTPSPAPSFKPIFRNPSSSSTSSHRRIGSIFERHRFVNLSSECILSAFQIDLKLH